MQRLEMRDYAAEHRKLNFSSTWHRNGLPSYQFMEDGKAVTLHHTVASSNDRTNDGICMMRHVDSDHTGESVFTLDALIRNQKPENKLNLSSATK